MRSSCVRSTAAGMLAFVLVTWLLGGVARAAARELSISDWISSFSSPGNLYGPWTIQTVRYQFQHGKDIPSITLFIRNDRDRPTASGSHALYIDDYHNWNPRFFTYAQLSAASGTIQPNRMAYAEGDWKLGARGTTVMALGGATMSNPDTTSTRYLSVGPTLYTGSMVYTLRFLPSDTNGVRASATQFSAEYNALGSNQITATFLDGSQPSVLVGFPPSSSTFQRLFEFDLTWKHWVTKRFGFTIGGTMSSHRDRTTGASIYAQRAIEFGLFFGRSVGLPR
ncbi:MAG: YaiO family outer membrane beta-barrel protein [Candidatus Eremiobacteraeota bacterium]|nr:YaiO family outer membrane beta-barrel protein [Candidatus Eremiobacteraeota bacterium]